MKRFLIVVLALWVAIGITGPASAAPSLQMNARVANEGRVRPGDWYTVITDLNNLGGELSGQLVIETFDPGGMKNAGQYVVPLTLPAGGKKRVPVDLPGSFNNRVDVRFEVGGKEIERATVNLSMLAPDVQLIGVLSEDELGIPALARPAQGGHAEVVRLDATTFPARAALLTSFNLIAISRFDTSLLSQEQRTALESWVGKGGTLIVTGGPEWKRTLSSLPPSLRPVAVNQTLESDLTTVGDLANTPILGRAPVSSGALLRGKALASAGSVPLVVLDQVGAGKVLYLAFDLGLEPLAKWPGQSDLFENALGLKGALLTQMDMGNNRDGMMQNALNQFPGWGMPSLITVFLLLGGYLLLLGPANYFILKRFDRREWAWVTVPVLSVLCVGAVYGFGAGGRSPLLSHVITITELASGTKTGTLSTYVGVYAPSMNTLDIDLGSARMVRTITGFSGPQGGAVTSRITLGDKTTVRFLGLNNYSMRSFATEQEVTVGGGVTLVDVHVDSNGKLTASLQNQLDQPLTDVQISFRMGGSSIGELLAGAKSAPFTLDLNAPKADPRMGFNIRMNGGFGPNQETNRRLSVLSAIFQSGRKQNANDKIMITGWTPSAIAATKLPGSGRTYQGLNLIFTNLPVPGDMGVAR